MSSANTSARLRDATLRFMRGERLSFDQSGDFLDALLDAEANDTQIAAALTAASLKGGSAEELAGMAEAMLARAVPIRSTLSEFIDTAGTGSSAAKTFNVSTAAAFVIAGAGLPVAKHGSRAATSRSGSADVLEVLGVKTDAAPETVERCLNEHGICFMFAPHFHRATARVAQVRRQLGFQTPFNLLGPLTNPARAPFRLLGVWNREFAAPMAEALRLLGVQRAWVVSGDDGLDEISLSGETAVIEVSAVETKAFSVSPQDFGLTQSSFAPTDKRGPEENAQLIKAILRGEEATNGARALVILNAAAALYVGGRATDLRAAANLARASIERGDALAKLNALVEATNSP